MQYSTWYNALQQKADVGKSWTDHTATNSSAQCFFHHPPINPQLPSLNFPVLYAFLFSCRQMCKWPILLSWLPRAGLNIWSLSLGKSCCLRSREVLSCHSQRLVIITGSWTCFKITGLFYVCWIQSLFPRVITVVLSWQFCGTACIWNWRGICA